MWWWVAAAIAGNPYQDRSADVVASLRIDTPADRVTRALSDLPRVAGLFGEGCLVKWQVGIPESGPGARARVTYTPHLMQRRLTLVVGEVRPGTRVVWEHEGKGGFETWWTVEAVPGGSVVSVEVPLEAPGWPLRRLYFEDIHPAWTDCYARAIRALGAPLTDDAMAEAAAREEAACEGADAREASPEARLDARSQETDGPPAR